ncbi:DNA replication complex GINS protein PSF2-like protein [Drosera capensis]
MAVEVELLPCAGDCGGGEGGAGVAACCRRSAGRLRRVPIRSMEATVQSPDLLALAGDDHRRGKAAACRRHASGGALGKREIQVGQLGSRAWETGSVRRRGQAAAAAAASGGRALWCWVLAEGSRGEKRRSLIEDIPDARFHKVDSARTHAVKLKNLSAMEVNIVRPLIARTLRAFYTHDSPEMIQQPSTTSSRRVPVTDRGPRRDLRRR